MGSLVVLVCVVVLFLCYRCMVRAGKQKTSLRDGLVGLWVVRDGKWIDLMGNSSGAFKDGPDWFVDEREVPLADE